VTAARTPVASTTRRRLRATHFQRELRRVGRLPQLAALEPLNAHSRLLALELHERRDEILALHGSKRRRRVAVQD